MPAFAPPTEWLEKVIRIDSVTHRSNEEIVRFLYPLLKESGLKIEEQKVTENGETFKNLIAFNDNLDSPDLLVLNTHLDTVAFGSGTDWTKTGGNPFRATRVGDRIYGLGTADVKIDFLCKLWAIRHARPWSRPFALVGTFGEERGLVGARHLLKSKKIRPKYALVGEPSNLELIYAHKGHILTTLSLDLSVGNVRFLSPKAKKTWKGKAAHSSTPDLGDNALQKGLGEIFKRGHGILSLDAGAGSNIVPDQCTIESVAQKTPATEKLYTLTTLLQDLSRELKQKRDARFSPGYSTLSLNLARTQDGILTLTFDIRTLPGFDSDRIRKRLEAIAKKSGFKVENIAIDEPLRGNKNSEFLVAASRALKDCGVKPERKTKASSTEAAVYNVYGAEAIVFGPGISVGNVHRPNEYNSLRQIGIASRFYRSFLQLPEGVY